MTACLVTMRLVPVRFTDACRFVETWHRHLGPPTGHESGASLRASGWRVLAERTPRRGWSVPSRPRVSHGADAIPRTLWEAS